MPRDAVVHPLAAGLPARGVVRLDVVLQRQSDQGTDRQQDTIRAEHVAHADGRVLIGRAAQAVAAWTDEAANGHEGL